MAIGNLDKFLLRGRSIESCSEFTFFEVGILRDFRKIRKAQSENSYFFFICYFFVKYIRSDNVILFL